MSNIDDEVRYVVMDKEGEQMNRFPFVVQRVEVTKEILWERT